MILNIVTCGKCGEPFGHKPGVEELTCPYCKYNDDISVFPDMWSDTSLIKINELMPDLFPDK